MSNDGAIWVMDSECCDKCDALLDHFETTLCTDCLHDAWYNEEQERYAAFDDDWYPGWGSDWYVPSEERKQAVKWSELSTEEKNRLIAEKIMGWQAKECDGEIGEQSISPDGWYCTKCGYSGSWGDAMVHDELVPCYTASLDLAWQVLQRMIEQYCTRGYSHDFLGEKNPTWERFCEAMNAGYFDAGNLYRWIAQWTPDRLCEAALIAVEAIEG